METGYDVRLYGKDVALRRYADANFAATDIMSAISEITPDEVELFLRKLSPDIVITGTSADDKTEKYLWQAAGNLDIPSIAIMDQWVNYGLRFSEYGVSEIAKYIKERSHPFLPSIIVAMDEYSRMEMIAEELPAERIVVCGQPYFETIVTYIPEPSLLSDCNLCNMIGEDDFVILYASEPITGTYGEQASDFWGYTEKSVFAALVRALSALQAETSRRLLLVIRPHPKEDREGLTDIVASCPGIQWSVDTKTPSMALMRRADLVCGMSSMFLIESVIMERPTMSIQIGLKRENPFILDRRGILASVLSYEELCIQLRRIIINKEFSKPRFDVISNPVERIISEMEKLLCQN
ncbi:MAG: hypothetical protein PHD54_13570 [Desulfuromonadaceae bacterium]|nr:hypothetical protein [Desulfuromonadaceae bacterium]